MSKKVFLRFCFSIILLVFFLCCTNGGANITVTPGNSSPTASFSVEGGVLYAEADISFDGSDSTDSDGSISSYSWNFGDGSTGTGATVDHRFTAPGDYTVTLTVVDNMGAHASHSEEITIVANTTGNLIPTASFTIESGVLYAGTNISFDASGSTDTDGSIVRYSWEFGDGSSGTGSSIDHLYASPGDYTVTLEVEDNQGAIDSRSESISIIDSPFPTPTAVISLSSNSVSWGGGVFFDGTGSVDPDNSGLRYSWDFGDSSPLNNEQGCFHNYGQSGTFTVTLKVTNGHGISHEVSQSLQVQPLQTLNGLTANAGLDQNETLAVNATMIYLDGSSSNSQEGSITSYSWTFSLLPPGSTMSDLLIRDADTATPYIDFDQERCDPNSQGYYIYELDLTVTDNSGTQVTDKVRLYLTGQGSGSLIIQ